MDRIIIHIDFDSYFASCEQQFDKKLRNKPIGVTAENGRTCIIAASKEAKKYGIKTGTRSWEAKKILKDIILVPAHFDKYYKITQKFLNICKDYSPLVELFSIDEVFIDLTPTIHLYPTLQNIVLDIKKRIRNEIGEIITVSIGMSHNKLLAKLASGLNKPDGFYVIKKDDIDNVYAKIKLTDLCGIGRALEIRLKVLGINSLLDLRQYPENKLKREFGNIRTHILKNMAYGIDESEVLACDSGREIKSIGRQFCLSQNEYDQKRILKIIYELCEEIALKLRKDNKRAKTIGMYLSGGKTMSAVKTVGKFTNLGEDIFSVCKFLYNSWHWNFMVRRIGIWTSNLDDGRYVNLELFADPRYEKVTKIVDDINKKFGHYTIRKGSLLYVDKLESKPNGFTK